MAFYRCGGGEKINGKKVKVFKGDRSIKKGDFLTFDGEPGDFTTCSSSAGREGDLYTRAAALSLWNAAAEITYDADSGEMSLRVVRFDMNTDTSAGADAVSITETLESTVFYTDTTVEPLSIQAVEGYCNKEYYEEIGTASASYVSPYCTILVVFGCTSTNLLYGVQIAVYNGGKSFETGTVTKLHSTAQTGYRLGMCKLSNGYVFVAHSYNTTYLMYGVVLTVLPTTTVSGTTVTTTTDTLPITAGTTTALQTTSGSKAGQEIAVTRLADNKVFIAHAYGSNRYLYGLVCTISGTTITKGTDTRLDTYTNAGSYWAYGYSAAALSESLVVVGGTNVTAAGVLNVMPVSISGTTVTAPTYQDIEIGLKSFSNLYGMQVLPVGNVEGYFLAVVPYDYTAYDEEASCLVGLYRRDGDSNTLEEIKLASDDSAGASDVSSQIVYIGDGIVAGFACRESADGYSQRAFALALDTCKTMESVTEGLAGVADTTASESTERFVAVVPDVEDTAEYSYYIQTNTITVLDSDAV